MKKKSLLWTFLVVTLLFSLASVRVNAQTTISVDPPSYTALGIGEVFAINVTIANVTNLYGWEFKLYYNTTILDGINATLPTGHFLTPVSDPRNLFVAAQDVNDTLGRVWFAVSLLPMYGPEPAKSGSGVLATIYFNSTALNGPRPLDISGAETWLYDDGGAEIPYTAVDGQVTVVPEFPAALIMPLFIAATLVAVILAKKGWSGKRKSPSLPSRKWPE